MNEAEGYGLIEVKQRDQSFRRVILGFWIPAMVWMMISGTLGYVLSVKLYKPEYLTHIFGLELSWLTYGRIFAVWQATTVFGWGASMMWSAGIWIMGRISGQNLQKRLTVGAGSFLWQLGVLTGVYLVLSGGNRGNTLLGLPYQAITICLAGALFLAWGLIVLKVNSEKKFISQDYILGSTFCLIWVLSTTLIFSGKTISGTMLGLLNHWAAHGVIYLFLIPMGIGTAYYLMPILRNRPIRFYPLAKLGFWLWILFACWSGTQGLTGAPLPIWLVGIGVTSAILLLLPITIIALNLLGGLEEEKGALHENQTLRFVAMSIVFLIMGGLTHVALGIANWSGIINLTHFSVGQLVVWVLGFVTFMGFGIFYYGLPYLTKCNPTSKGLTKMHFWTVFYGTVAFAILMLVAGIVQGLAIKNSDLSFNQVIEGGLPYYRGRVIAFGIYFIGAVAFGLNLIKMIFGELIFPRRAMRRLER